MSYFPEPHTHRKKQKLNQICLIMQQNITYKIEQVLVYQVAKKASLKSDTDK